MVLNIFAEQQRHINYLDGISNWRNWRLTRGAKDQADIQNTVHETSQAGSPHTISSRRHLKMKSVDRQALLIPLCLSRRFWGPIAPIRATDSAGMTCSSRPTAIFLSCTFTSQNNAEAHSISDTPAMRQVFTYWNSPHHKSKFRWRTELLSYKVAEEWGWPSASIWSAAGVKNARKYAATPQIFVTWCLTERNINAFPRTQVKNARNFATTSQQPLRGMVSKKARKEI